MKKVLHTQRSDTPHWVGDGFPVRTVFNYMENGAQMTPFLLMDYGGPTVFPPSEHIRGVGEHPHRGFETVTIVYSGEVEHRDSSGGGGLIKPGDVQWMTAAAGLVHDEFYGKEFAQRGGEFEMIQLWVNLPREFKMHKPRYQTLKNDIIPVVELPKHSGQLRVIAGEYENHKGPANTFSPINLWDIKLNKDQQLKLKVPEGHTATIFVLSGEVTNFDGSKITEAELGIFDREGTELSVTANEQTRILFMGGEPINEPIVGYGPFVMNTPGEIAQAFKDFQDGKMGVLDHIEGTE